MQMPVFIVLFLAPVYVPLDLLAGWVEAVAHVNPFTALVEGGRDLISGQDFDVWLMFAIAIGLGALFLAWAMRGVHRAEMRRRLGLAAGERLAEALAGRLHLLEVRRLLDHLEVDHPLAERVERVGADDRVQRDAGLSRARADLADELALQRLLVELALAGDDGPRGASSARRSRARRARTARRPPAPRHARPTARRRARRRRRSSARRAGPSAGAARTRRAAARAARSSLRRPPSGARTPSARPRTWCARRSARRSSPSRSRRAASIACERAGAAVGRRRAADRHQDHLRPAFAAAAISSPVPYVLAAHASRSSSATSPSPTPSPSRRSPSRRPRPARTRSAPASPSGPCTSTAINSPPSCGSSASSVPSPAVGHRAQVRRHQPRLLQPAPDRPRHLRRH